MVARTRPYPADDFGALRRSFWLVPVSWGASIGIFSILVLAGIVQGRAALWITNAAWTLSSLIAAIASWQTSRRMTAQRRTAWTLFAAACAVWLLGQLVWDWNVLVIGLEQLFPTLADLGYAGFAVLFSAGLLYYRSAQPARRLVPQRLANLALILCSLAVVLNSLVVEPLAETRRPPTFVVAAVAESLCFAATFLLAIYSMWSYRWQQDLRPMLLIVASLTVHGLCILTYTYRLLLGHPPTGALNVGWIVAFALQHWAAVTQARHEAHDSVALDVYQGEGWIEALLPGSLLIFIAFTVSLNDAPSDTSWVHIGLIAVFAIILAYRESWMYSRGLQLKWRLEQMETSLDSAEHRLHRAEDIHRGLQQDIELVARAGGVALLDWDLKTRAIRYSKEWKRQLGYAEGELTDDSEEWRSRLHPDDAERVLSALDRFLRDPQGELTIEARLLHRDGSYRYILSRATILRDPTGTPIRMLSSHVDITQLKETEVALRDSEARYRNLAGELEQRIAQRTGELSEALRDSRSFAYAVAHDLRSPLRAIDSFCHFLAESSASRLTETERSHIDRVRGGAMHMASLIDGLLAYSRVEHHPVSLEGVDLPACIDEVVATFANQIDASGATVEINVEPTQVLADQEGFRLVLRNLLDNALKFSRTAPQPRVEVGASLEDQRILLWVKDNGSGFDQAYHDKMFGIFERLHSDGTIEGTGIGLALARKAVQRMGGRIWAESVLGQGATFYVELRRFARESE
jgi:PAS domain S-box-containing protein